MNATNLFLNDPQSLSGFSQVLEELPTPGAAPTASYAIGNRLLAQEKGGRVSRFHSWRRDAAKTRRRGRPMPVKPSQPSAGRRCLRAFPEGSAEVPRFPFSRFVENLGSPPSHDLRAWPPWV